jgi:integration host factor subunit beta
MDTKTKRDIAERVAGRTGQAQSHIREAIHVFLQELVDELVAGNRLEFRNFGVFEVVLRKPRTGRNPRTGEPVAVPAKRVVNFRMGKQVRERIAKNTPPEGC